jgi:nucleotide-binding universal stress UspA family protein
MIPTSGPSAAAETADYAMQVADALDAEVVVLHVLRPGKARESGELTMSYFEEAAQQNEVNVETHIVEGLLIGTIIDFAEENDVDLIVMGASNGNIVDKWVSSDVRENTTIPVLIIPYQMFD